MRKFIKNQLIELIETITSGIEYAVSNFNNSAIAQNMLMDCYEGLDSAHQRINNNVAKGKLYEYKLIIDEIKDKLELLNEAIFNNSDFDDLYNTIKEQMSSLKSMITNEKIKREIVFFPYKASMWDSLESIWLAAKEDENCDAYVVPIPYFDKNPDKSLGEMHYEGDKFPDYVPVVDWNSYKVDKRMPDVVYVHNPYDGYNFVTSVHPDYYSDKLKQYTDTLVYVPYYASGGGCGETVVLPSYFNYDYVINQSELMKKSFKGKLPDEKMLVLGTPKLDRVVSMCKNPPEIPEQWMSRMSGKKVYLYNTALASLLSNTEVFLEKMKYVFETFKGREDSVLLWRPHPLFESTIKSMRPQYYVMYLQLKKYFLENDIGIIDTTPDIENSIALSDAYIAVSGSSVETLFGIAGKPMFMLNIYINQSPAVDDWRGHIIRPLKSNLNYMFTAGGKLFSAKELGNKREYEYLCNTSEYTSDYYYIDAQKVGNKIYLCPYISQNIGVVENNIFTKIPLERLSEDFNNFEKMYIYKNYIVLIPCAYPAIVRYNMDNGQIDYFKENIDVFTANVNTLKVVGGSCIRGNIIFISSPIDNLVVAFDIITGKQQVLTTSSKSKCGCLSLFDDGKDLWFMPMNGITITRWNPTTGDVQEYSKYPKNFCCINRIFNVQAEENPFCSAVDTDKFILFAPWWANMFIKIDKMTGEITEWESPFEMLNKPINGYYESGEGNSWFMSEKVDNDVYVFLTNNKKIYKLNLMTNEYQEIEVEFNTEFLANNAIGFRQVTEWALYVCMENSFNTLERFLDGQIKDFNREEQIKFYSQISANSDGTCGQKIHEFIIAKLK